MEFWYNYPCDLPFFAVILDFSVEMKVGGSEYVRKKSLGSIAAVAGFSRMSLPYEKPKLKFKRMCKYDIKLY